MSRLGVWAQAASSVRGRSDPAELLRYHGRYQIVEGRVTRVAQLRGLIYLNFGSFRRHAFFASLRDADRAVLGGHAREPKGLEGRHVRLRGWIERRRDRPAIDLSAAGMIEVSSQPRRRATAPVAHQPYVHAAERLNNSSGVPASSTAMPRSEPIPAYAIVE